MQKETLSVGDPIEGRCTKCRKNTAHVVVTLDGPEPGRVQCTRCDRQHPYRPPTVPKKAATRRTVDPRESERKEWQELRPEMDPAKARDYSMTAAYRIDALIRHPVFGLGVVQRVAGPQKVEVLFEEGRKTMRCS